MANNILKCIFKTKEEWYEKEIEEGKVLSLVDGLVEQIKKMENEEKKREKMDGDGD